MVGWILFVSGGRSSADYLEDFLTAARSANFAGYDLTEMPRFNMSRLTECNMHGPPGVHIHDTDVRLVINEISFLFEVHRQKDLLHIHSTSAFRGF